MLDKILSAKAESDLTSIAFELLEQGKVIELMTEMSKKHISFSKSFEFDVTPSQIQKSIQISPDTSGYDLKRNLHDRLLLLSKNNIALQKTIFTIMQKFYDE